GETLCQRVAAAAWPHATAPKGKVTLSIGLATWQTDMSPEDIYKRSDQALYHAKANGRDNCQVAAP
ncbi:MAG: diguanylate cyclase, partial [Dechloromonas sp.]|nr:diguanylate cyclase [Dechloromonas sp.]